MTLFIAGLAAGMILMFVAQLPQYHNERKRDRFNVLSVLRKANLIDDYQYEVMLREREGIDIKLNPKNLPKHEETVADRERARMGVKRINRGNNARDNMDLLEPRKPHKEEVIEDAQV